MSTNISFSGAGFLGVYHIGVISCLKAYGRKLLDGIACYGGCSAGAMAAVAILCDLDLEECLLAIMDIAAKVRDTTLGPFSASFDPVNTIRKNCKATLPANAYKVASGKLFVSLTRVTDWKNVVVSEFGSNEDLTDALVCTSFIPFYCGVVPPKFQGVSYIDGAFSNNLVQDFEGTTITVSVFSGDSDICPDDGQRNNLLMDLNNVTIQFNRYNIYRLLRALIPFQSSSLAALCRQGFRDTLKYMNSHYPEKLSIDVDIVSIPNCYRRRQLNEGNSSTRELSSDVTEREIAILPEQLSEVLSKAEKVVVKRDLLGYVINILLKLLKWLLEPCYYIAEYMCDIVYNMLYVLIEQLDVDGDNLVVQKIVNIAKEIYTAYAGGDLQLHPSLDKDQRTDVLKIRKDLSSAEKSSTMDSDGKSVSGGLEDKTDKREASFSSRSLVLLNKLRTALFQDASAERDYGSDLDHTTLLGEC